MSWFSSLYDYEDVTWRLVLCSAPESPVSEVARLTPDISQSTVPGQTNVINLMAQLRFLLTLKIPGPHFPSNYQVNANWHEGFNGIFCSLFAFSESSCWCLYVVQVWPEPYMSSEWLNPPFLVQNSGGKTGAKMLPWQILANWQDAVF